jgi:ABC-type transporter Mla maintaining outer membrane lipid asymmetry ATPase subunit MlaF
MARQPPRVGTALLVTARRHKCVSHAGASLEATWDQSVPPAERIGFLFQKGVLVDALNLAENIAFSLRASGLPYTLPKIDAVLQAVGLSGAMDGAKMPGEVRCPPPADCALARTCAPMRPS